MHLKYQKGKNLKLLEVFDTDKSFHKIKGLSMTLVKCYLSALIYLMFDDGRESIYTFDAGLT